MFQQPRASNVRTHPLAPPRLQACHTPKPILLNLGALDTPYPWLPSVVDVSLFRLGNLVIANLPGEPTTMAGRRIQEALRATIGTSFGANLIVR